MTSAIPFPWELPDHVRGIDVANPQPDLPWEEIAAAGVVTTSIKATDFTRGGRPFTDSMLDKHQEGAIHRGNQIVDYYAFLHSDLSGRLQAEFFAKTVEKRPRMARWWADFEDAHRISPDPRRAHDCLCEFMATGKKLLGEDGGIYTYPSIMPMLAIAGDLSDLLRYDLWIAHYRVDPASGKDYGLTKPLVPEPWKTLLRSRGDVLGWQPGLSGCVVGWQVTGNIGPRIKGCGPIDNDVFFGGRPAFDRWCHAFDRHEPGPTQPDSPANPLGWQDRAEQVAEDDEGNEENSS